MVNVIKKEEIAKLVACANYAGFIYLEDRVDIDGMYYFCEAFNYCYVDINYLVMNVDYVDGKYKGIVQLYRVQEDALIDTYG